MKADHEIKEGDKLNELGYFVMQLLIIHHETQNQEPKSIGN